MLCNLFAEKLIGLQHIEDKLFKYSRYKTTG